MNLFQFFRHFRFFDGRRKYEKWKLPGNVIASEARAWRSFQKALLLPKEEYPKGEVVCCLELLVTSSSQREEEVSRSVFCY
ncbi:hypothetical protein AO058_16375 [Salegentibacter sp. T436]|nr:hypothetical protein AO058_16375 [Salegentibacter sp. T436]